MWIAIEQTGFCTRLFAIDAAGQVAKRATIAPLAEADLAPAIQDFAGQSPEAIVVCGMDSDGFRPLPATPLAEAITPTALGPAPRIGVSGLRQSRPPATTSGAEAKIAGFLSVNPDFDGIICLPDHETTWAHISANEVVSMQVFATAYLAECLAGKDADLPDPASGAFQDAVSDTISKPERLALQLGAARSQGRLGGQSASDIMAQCWGALLGAELSAARPYWLGQQVAVVAPSGLGGLYTAAMTTQGVNPIHADAEGMLVKGLKLAREKSGA